MTGEQHEGLAVGPGDEVLDPMDQCVLIAGITGIGHFSGDEQGHLSGIIKRRTHLKALCLVTPYPTGHIPERRYRSRSGQLGADGVGRGHWGPWGRNRRSHRHSGRPSRSQGGAGQDHGGSRFKETLTQVVGHLDRSRIQREILLGLPRALHPIDMILGCLTQKGGDGHLEVRQTAVAFHQLLAGLLVLGGLDELMDLLAEALQRQGQTVLDQIRPADTQLLPDPRRLFTGRGPFRLRRGRRAGQFLAGILHPNEKIVGLLEHIGHQSNVGG